MFAVVHMRLWLYVQLACRGPDPASRLLPLRTTPCYHLVPVGWLCRWHG